MTKNLKYLLRNLILKELTGSEIERISTRINSVDGLINSIADPLFVKIKNERYREFEVSEIINKLLNKALKKFKTLTITHELSFHGSLYYYVVYYDKKEGSNIKSILFRLASHELPPHWQWKKDLNKNEILYISVGTWNEKEYDKLKIQYDDALNNLKKYTNDKTLDNRKEMIKKYTKLITDLPTPNRENEHTVIMDKNQIKQVLTNVTKIINDIEKNKDKELILVNSDKNIIKV